MKENKDFKITVRFDESTKNKMDAYCEDSELNYSQLIRLAVKEYLNKKGE